MITMTTTKNLFIIAFLSILFSSCSTTFYQVYKTETDADLKTANQQLIYEDADCKISYNLWDNQGDIGFMFHNKTNQNIVVNLEESFFIVNGIAHNYYKDRIYTNTSAIGSSVTTEASASKLVSGTNFIGMLQGSQGLSSIGTSGRSVAYTEAKTMIIPPKTAKIIKEYSINNTLYRDCDLYKYPRKSQIKTLNFGKNDSPLVFNNRIAYSQGESTDLVRVENSFYVSAITNYPENELLESRKEEVCGEKVVHPTKYLKEAAPNKFYLRYIKANDSQKH